MAGGKGGSQTSEVKIPTWLEEPVKRNLARGETAAGIGYMPYYGPDVAALSPQQESAMRGANTAASAFGLSTPDAFSTGLPQAQTFAGGVRGYSSGDLFDQAVQEFANRRPEQAATYNRLFDQKAMYNNPQQWNAVSATGYDPMAVGTSGTSTMTDAQFNAQMAQGAQNAMSLGQMGLIPMSWATAMRDDAIAKAKAVDPLVGQTQSPAPVYGGSNYGGYSPTDGWSDTGTYSQDSSGGFGGVY